MARRIGAGLRRERFAFDPLLTQNDGYGNEQQSWDLDNAVTRRAEVRYMRGAEREVAGLETGNTTFKLRILQSGAARQVTTDWRARLLRTGETFEIVDVDRISDRKFMWISAVLQTGVTQ